MPRQQARMGLTARFGAATLALALLVALLTPMLSGAADWAPPEAVYFPRTGHHLEGDFLKYWRSNGKATLLGEPISERLTAGGLSVQYFERVRLEYHPDLPAGERIVLGQLGSDAAAARVAARARWTRHGRIGRDPGADMVVVDPFKPLSASPFPPDAEDFRFFPETGHTIGNSFKLCWENNGGLAQFGLPLSEETPEVSPIDGQVYTTQYFERARFEYHPETPANYSVVLTPLGLAAASMNRVETVSIARKGGVNDYSEVLFTPPPTPTPTTPPTPTPTATAPVPTATATTPAATASTPAATARAATATVAAPTATKPAPTATVAPPTPTATAVSARRPAGTGRKWIDVDLSEQYLTAYEGETVVWEGYISSGKRGYETPVGTYSIFTKLRSEDMRGPDPDEPGGRYFQPDVPYVMYFAGGGYAIHGVYWHSAFGSPRSHGCVGTPVGGAAFLYEWAPIGTAVVIHY